jgi:hypothetical protein
MVMVTLHRVAHLNPALPASQAQVVETTAGTYRSHHRDSLSNVDTSVLSGIEQQRNALPARPVSQRENLHGRKD